MALARPSKGTEPSGDLLRAEAQRRTPVRECPRSAGAICRPLGRRWRLWATGRLSAGQRPAEVGLWKGWLERRTTAARAQQPEWPRVPVCDRSTLSDRASYPFPSARMLSGLSGGSGRPLKPSVVPTADTRTHNSPVRLRIELMDGWSNRYAGILSSWLAIPGSVLLITVRGTHRCKRPLTVPKNWCNRLALTDLIRSGDPTLAGLEANNLLGLGVTSGRGRPGRLRI